MDIIILANFCGDLGRKGNDRFLYLAQMLSVNNDVEVITSDFFHEKKKHRGQVEQTGNFKMTLLYEPGYKKNVSIRRFYSHYIWGKDVVRYIRNRKKPDIIYCAIPSLTGPYFVSKYCEKENIHFAIDVQDLWPEAFRMVCNIPLLSDLAFYPFKRVADAIYNRADKVIAVSQTYVNRVLEVNRKDASGCAVFIGTELETFDENVRNNAIDSQKAGELWLGYCGSLGASYDLITVIDAITLLKDSYKEKVKFIIMGDGERRTEFETYARKKEVQCDFVGRLPYDKMCGMLSACDIVINPITGGSAASIINKHADYAACGKPVINTQDSLEYRRLIDDYRMGFNCENANATDMASKLEVLLKDSELRTVMGNNARRCAKEKFDRRTSYKRIVDILMESGNKS